MSTELDARKDRWASLDHLLRDLAHRLAQEVPAAYPNELNVVFFPQIGFLAVMPKDPEAGLSLWEGDGEDQWQLMFTTEDEAYYKNGVMRALDTEYGDVWGDLCGTCSW